MSLSDPFGAGPFDPTGSSFSAALRRAGDAAVSADPPALSGDATGRGGADNAVAEPAQAPRRWASGGSGAGEEAVEGTTVLAMTYDRGVVMAADRRATAGNVISRRDIRKIYPADDWSGVAFAGAAGPGIELAKVLTLEIEHYEKVEGSPLSLEGKANRLAQMIRGNLEMAMQGLAVVPLFAGWDLGEEIGRIYEYDVVGGHYAERAFATQGSGGRDAQGSLKARYIPGLSQDAAADMALTALWDAADEDAATGGPDPVRGIYPLVAVIDENGYRELPDEQISEGVERVVGSRQT